MKSAIFALLVVCCSIGIAWAESLGTGFTYQGELNLAGAPATGNFDFKFDLFDVDTEGAEIASSVEIEDVQVTEGVFTVDLDFGAGAFASGQQLWLQIAVRSGDSIEDHTVLSPRQKLTATPVAIVSMGYEHQPSPTNTRVGEGALSSNESLFATAVGAEALGVNTTGYGNTALGAWALRNSVSGDGNVAVGYIALVENINGAENTAVGGGALNANISGNSNTAIGFATLGSSQAERRNTAVGAWALRFNLENNNTAVGAYALTTNETGWENVAVGSGALSANVGGSGNIAVGAGAGEALTSGSHNIVIGNTGAPSDSSTTRIGSVQDRTFISGIRGVTTDVADAVPVMIDSNGQLGTVSSSRRVKQDIQGMPELGEALLQLRPVTFRYIRKFEDGAMPLQYGLIAEEVAQVFPDLVVFGADGEPETVKYHLLSTLLLQQFQAQHAQLSQMREEVSELRAAVRQLTNAGPVVAVAAVK